MGRLVNTRPISYTFYVDQEISFTSYTLPSTIPTSVPSPVYARVKNTGNSTLTVSTFQIIFLGGLPAQGSPQTLTTIAPNETKYFVVNARLFPSSYVQWSNSNIIVKQPGITSIKKQNLTRLKAQNQYSDAVYRFKSATTNNLGTMFNAPFSAGNDAITIYYQGTLDGPNSTFLSNGPGFWTDPITEEEMNDYVIPANSIIIFSCITFNINILVSNGTVIEKYYTGKLLIESVPSLIVNGLVFHVDPSNTSCYSGSGSSCNDLSGINGTGTLSNVSFDNAEKYFSMNADTSRIYFNRSYTNNTNSLTFIVTCFIPFTGVATYPNIMSSLNENFGGATIYLLSDAERYVSSYISENSGSLYDEIISNIGTQTQKRVFALTINNNIFRLYVDGNLKSISSPHAAGNVNSQSTITLGCDYLNSALPSFPTVQGLGIYNSLIYNRALSDTEIRNNYRYLRSRYKL